MLLFPVLAVSRLVHLTDENYNSVVNNSEGLPCFVEVYSPFCKHCEEFAPVWESIARDRKWNGKLIFADLDCYSYGKLCRLFEGEGTPRMIWLDFGSSKGKEFFGDRTVEAIEQFIQKQLNPVIMTFESLEQVKAHDPAFLFQVGEDDYEVQELVDRVTRSRQNLKVSFFSHVDGNKTEPKLTWYSRGREVDYDGVWSDVKVGQFVDRHCMPFMSEYSSMIQYITISRRLPLTVFLLPSLDRAAKERMVPYVEAIDSDAATVVTDCQTNRYICRYTGRSPGASGNAVHMGPGYDEFWTYDKELDVNELKRWMNDIQERRVRGQGPGRSAMVHAFYDLRATGGFKYYVIYTPIVITLGVVILALVLFFLPDQPVRKEE